MKGPRGFDVRPNNPLPEAGAALLPDDLPFVRLFPDSGDRLPPGAWRFYNGQQALGAVWAWLVLLAGAGILVFSVVYRFTDRGGDEQGLWKVTAGAGAALAVGGFGIYLSVRRLRALARVAVVVKARVEAVGGVLPGSEVPVDFVFTLYGNRYPVKLALGPVAAGRLTRGESVHLIADASSPMIQCYWDPKAAATAVDVALRTAAASPERVAPLARVARPAAATAAGEAGEGGGVAPGDETWEFTLRFSLTPADDSEAAAAAALPKPPEALRREQWRAQLFGWLLFIALAVLLVLIVGQSRPSKRRLPYLWPWAGSPVAVVAGLSVVAAGTALFALAKVVKAHSHPDPTAAASEVTCRVSPQGLHYTTPDIDQSVDWQAYDRFVETVNLFVICRAGGEYRAIPRRAFADEDTRTEFARRVGRRLPRPHNILP